MSPRHHNERLIELIEQTYAAALTPSHWPSVTLGLADMFGGCAALVMNDPMNGEASLRETANFHLAYVRSYEGHYGRTNPWVREFLRFPVGSLLHRDLVPELRLEPTEYYND